MRLIKINDRIINLEKVTYINLNADVYKTVTHPDGSTTSGYFKGGVQVFFDASDQTSVKDEDVEALRHHFTDADLERIDSPFMDLTTSAYVIKRRAGGPG